MKGYFVYKFMDGDNVLYVGKSKRVKTRVLSHIRDKDWVEAGVEVYVAELDSKVDMDIYELYYISSLAPKYNIVNTDSGDSFAGLSELEFSLYKTISEEDLPIIEEEVGVYDYRSLSYAFTRKEEGFYGYTQIAEKYVYTNFVKYLNDLDFLIGYDFRATDCGNERYYASFMLSTGKSVGVGFEGSFDEVITMPSFCFTAIRSILIDIYNSDDNPRYSTEISLDLSVAEEIR